MLLEITMLAAKIRRRVWLFRKRKELPKLATSGIEEVNKMLDPWRRRKDRAIDVAVETAARKIAEKGVELLFR